ncbi:MAG: DegT/DnrJ/EryC1/StrS family aminotransferase [Candidatus Marinimicrobia bacterium]|nr:DegT/DnrJ/EryC1/StrS family aminotransferase [Candidatus Neomarinimicrobiota bacterium]
MIAHNKPSLGKEEVKALENVIKSGYIAQGERVKRLEKDLTEFIGKKYCICTSSGTAALILALKAMDIGKDDEVIIPSYTCSALWHAVKLMGATPILCDIELTTYNLAVVDIKKKITEKTRAIIFPHMFGQPGYIEEVLKLEIPVIEDIAQSIGSKIKGKQTGSFGYISIASFYATKFICGGEGGAVLTDDESIYDKVMDMRDYDEKNDLNLRFNFKMNELEAAVTNVQLSKIKSFISIRKKIFDNYLSILGDHIEIPNIKLNNFDYNYFRVIASHSFLSPDQVIKKALEYGIVIRKPVYKPLHMYANKEKLMNTEMAWYKQFSLPIYPELDKKDFKVIVDFLRTIYD